jgi:hypothetical protein
MPCCVPGCRRTTKAEHGFKEWVCATHWQQVSRRNKAAYNLAKRRARKIIAKKPAYQTYWTLPPGSPARLSAVSLWRRLDQAWSKCRDEAIETAMGI